MTLEDSLVTLANSRLKHLFLDRDGIINSVVMRADVVGSPRSLQEFEIRDDFIEFYNQTRELNLTLYVVSNQPDIRRGLMQEDILIEMSKVLHSRFEFAEILYCRHDNSDRCACRKPKPGMLMELLQKFCIDPEEALMVGDSPKDIEAAHAANVKSVLLKTQYNMPYAEAKQPTLMINSLRELFSSLEKL